MCRQFEEVMAMGKAEGRVEGKAEGRAEEKERSILSVLNNGVSEEETARLLNLAIEEVRQAATRQKASGASLQSGGASFNQTQCTLRPNPARDCRLIGRRGELFMRDLLKAARPEGVAQGAAEERVHMAIRALMAGMSEEVAAEIASLPSAILTVLVEALKKRERALSKGTQGRRARTG